MGVVDQQKRPLREFPWAGNRLPVGGARAYYLVIAAEGAGARAISSLAIVAGEVFNWTAETRPRRPELIDVPPPGFLVKLYLWTSKHSPQPVTPLVPADKKSGQS